jgi:hypothetical protein
MGVDGNVVILGTNGVIADGGFPRSATSGVISFVMQANTSTVGRIPTYSSTRGTLTDSGLAPQTVVTSGTSSGSAGDVDNCNAPNAWPITIGGVLYYIPLFIQNT